MKNLITITILLPIILAAALTGCTTKNDKQRAELQETLETIDHNVGVYDPSVVSKEESSHRALTITFTKGIYSLDTLSTMEPRKGRLPYTLMEKGTSAFRVQFFDAQNNMIGSYPMEHPRLLRSCETESPAARLLDSLRFEILIPNNKNIRIVKIAEQKKIVATFNLPEDQ